MGNIVLLDLVGGIALLLWGLHMVQSGILRAFGADLRRFLGVALRNRFTAFLAGIGTTALLQSSTATALMTSTFVADGLVGLVPALAIMLGANVGTTLIVQVLSFNVAGIAPVLFVLGLVAFRSGPRSRIKDLGRVSIGLGLMLLALHILLDTLAPAENAPSVGVIMNAITGDPVLCIVVAAAITWAVHSSVASVLLIMSLAYAHFITPEAALALVLGEFAFASLLLKTTLPTYLVDYQRDAPQAGMALALAVMVLTALALGAVVHLLRRRGLGVSTTGF